MEAAARSYSQNMFSACHGGNVKFALVSSQMSSSRPGGYKVLVIQTKC